MRTLTYNDYKVTKEGYQIVHPDGNLLRRVGMVTIGNRLALDEWSANYIVLQEYGDMPDVDSPFLVNPAGGFRHNGELRFVYILPPKDFVYVVMNHTEAGIRTTAFETKREAEVYFKETLDTSASNNIPRIQLR